MKLSVGSTFFWLGQAPWIDGIQARRTHYNKFVESESKSWALMRQRLAWKVEMVEQELKTQGWTGSQSEGTSSSPDGMNSHLVRFTKGMKEEPGSPSPPPLLPKAPSPFPRRRSFTLYGFFSIHPDPTPVSHPCPHLSARPISYSF